MLPSSTFYDTIAYTYESYCEFSEINSFLENEIKLLETFKPSSVLEFGIGNGRFAREYLKKHNDVIYVGVDNSKEMIRGAANSGAILVFADFCEYIKQAISVKIKFDCIIAPYTAIHHVRTSAQLELFENMKQVSDVILINCVTKKEEMKLFANTNETLVTYMLPDGNNAKTVVYRIHENIRKETRAKEEGRRREYLIWKKK